jgi:hypothetical protein
MHSGLFSQARANMERWENCNVEWNRQPRQVAGEHRAECDLPGGSCGVGDTSTDERVSCWGRRYQPRG